MQQTHFKLNVHDVNNRKSKAYFTSKNKGSLSRESSRAKVAVFIIRTAFCTRIFHCCYVKFDAINQERESGLL
jgi:hypothetical protein